MESIAKELQHVAQPQDEHDRAIAVAKPSNEKVCRAADTRLRFEDEPSSYVAFLNQK
jgi:hypothetical protein